ncbi:hypothetical protein E1B28_009532 [Marasmius oreades]|uniref:Uncharacterized protein n=1 Tax=Marasmius oreades TaxID=181124 RepID=A0A9P7RVY6_9AGAR|nr:uncharacterized protein E1B28_009532 [Marasmius oreades]KAG7090412.1 hypothetical protein E1B28_009532 [Marasmius oreades]
MSPFLSSTLQNITRFQRQAGRRVLGHIPPATIPDIDSAALSEIRGIASSAVKGATSNSPPLPPTLAPSPSKTISHAPSTQTQFTASGVTDITAPATSTTASNNSTSMADGGASVASTDNHTSAGTAGDTTTNSFNLISSRMTAGSQRLGSVVAASTTVPESTVSMTTQAIIQSSITASHSQKDTSTIVGSVAGAVVLLSLSIWVALWYYRRCLNRRPSTSDRQDVSPCTASSPTQGCSADKFEAEGENTRTYRLTGRQEVIGSDVDRQEDGHGQSRRSACLDSVIVSGDTMIFIPPPSYRP